MSDLTGTTFCITGANTGIGEATAVALARRGGRVLLACRSRERAGSVLSAVSATAGSAEFIPLDLGDLESVSLGAQRVLALDEPVHVLINNAGVAGQRGLTASGFELMFGINHVGHFLWTEMLTERLVASARAGRPSRIVVVSSDSHYSAKSIDFDAVRTPTKSRTGLPEYAVSKLANVLHTQELARRLDPATVTTSALHPGVIASDIWRRVPWPARVIMRRFMKSTEEGAETSIHCATSPDAIEPSGAFYADRARKPASDVATADLASELWARSEKWVAGHRRR